MPRYAPNKMPTAVKKRYFELIRSGMKGAAAARVVGVSTSCGSLWFLDAGGVILDAPQPISPRFLTQDDRIAIADGLHAGLSKKQIAAGIGKSFQTVYREIRLNSKPDGRYQPWWAHNQVVLRRRRPKPVKLAAEPRLRRLVLAKLKVKWSPQQIARFLARTAADTGENRVCAETIYRALFAGLLGKKPGKLRTGRCCRKRQRRGSAPRNDIPNIRPLSQRPASVEDRVEPGHWEGDRATRKSHVRSGYTDWRLIDEGVTRSSVEWIVPALACVMGDRGVRSPGKKPKGPRSIRGLRARGRPDG